ncbi:MAG: hypothetical protein RL557_821 [archaeon]|jgi:superfamily I DNA/RNA helicase
MGELANILPERKELFEQTIITEEDKHLFQELDHFFAPYNDFQKKAIISDKKRICCIAGAGSGKTTVLTKRIEFLIKYKGVDPKKILAITFTRKARHEMQERLVQAGITTNIETFNSFCEKILRNNQFQVYGKPVRMMDHSTKLIALSFSLQSLNLKLDNIIEDYFSELQKKNKTKEELTAIFLNDCFFIIDYCKAKKQEISELSKFVSGKMGQIFLVCKTLNQYIKLHGFRSFNDQLVDTLEFFKKKLSYIPQYDYVLVDEYQDVNMQQTELLHVFSAPHLFVVGDPRQSIFGWRGSDINHILQFGQIYPESETIILTKNYRSTQHIVALMNNAIKDLQFINLEAHNKGDKNLFLHNFSTEFEELSFVLEKIIQAGHKKNKIFVLARTNRQLNDVATRLKQKNIPYVIKKEDDFYQQKDEVTLSTIHAIKGLEADIVFVIGCNEQHFPCKYSDHPIMDLLNLNDYNKEHEEKRLFYVAISRAKHTLYLTYSGKKPTYFINNEMKLILDIQKNERESQQPLFEKDEDFLEKDFRKAQEMEDIESEDPYRTNKESWDDMISD